MAWRSLILSWNLHGCSLLLRLIHQFPKSGGYSPSLPGPAFWLLGNPETEEQNRCCSWTLNGSLCKISTELSLNKSPFLLYPKQIISWNSINKTFDKIYQISMSSFKNFFYCQTIPPLRWEEVFNSPLHMERTTRGLIALGFIVPSLCWVTSVCDDDFSLNEFH